MSCVFLYVFVKLFKYSGVEIRGIDLCSLWIVIISNYFVCFFYNFGSRCFGGYRRLTTGVHGRYQPISKVSMVTTMDTGRYDSGHWRLQVGIPLVSNQYRMGVLGNPNVIV